MFINIPDDVAKRLEILAEQEGSTVGEVLQTMLDRYKPQSPAGTLAALAQNAREAGLASSKTVDTAERSREILNQEFADYIKNRMNDTNDHHNG